MGDINVVNRGIPYTVGTGATTGTTAGDAVAINNSIYGEGYVSEECQPQTSQNVNNQTSQKETKEIKHTRDEIYEKIKNICEKCKIDLSEVKANNVLENIAGPFVEKMGGIVTLDDKALDNLIKCFEAAIIKITGNGHRKNLSENYMEQISELGNKYLIAVMGGWTIKEFQKAQEKNADNFTERLRAQNLIPQDKSLDQMSPEEVAEAINSYLKNMYKTLKKNGTPREKINVLIQTDFAKLLANSDDNERKAIFGSFKYIKENVPESDIEVDKFKALKILMHSFKDRKNLEEAADVNYDLVRTIALGGSEEDYSKRYTEAERQAMVRMLLKIMGKKGIEDAERCIKEETLEFIAANKDNINKIILKKTSGEELTDEEKAISKRLDELTGVNNLLDVELVTRKENDEDSEFYANLLIKRHKSIREANENYYRQYVEQLNKYFEENAEELSISKESFTKCLNEATDGNYSNIINEAGSTNSAVAAEKSAYNSDAYGFTIETDINETVANKTYLFNKVAETDSNRTNNFVESKRQNYPTVEAFLMAKEVTHNDINEYFKLNPNQATLEILNSNAFHGYAYQKALAHFNNMSDELQQNMVNGIEKADSRADALKLMSLNALKKIKGTSFIENLMIKMIVDMREKQNGIKQE